MKAIENDAILHELRSLADSLEQISEGLRRAAQHLNAVAERVEPRREPGAVTSS